MKTSVCQKAIAELMGEIYSLKEQNAKLLKIIDTRTNENKRHKPRIRYKVRRSRLV